MKHGFTLSEILITLGIVGVVAVLTVPSVMKNYRNRMYVAQLQKTYSQINDAATAIMNDEHVDNFYETSAIGKNICMTLESLDGKTATSCSASGIEYFLTTYFKSIKKNCATGNNRCTATSYTNLNGSNIGTISAGYCIQTVNGATICGSYNNSNSVLSLITDINGPAEPNIAGRDVFSMDIKTDASISDYASGSNNPTIAGASAANCGISTTNTFSSAAGCLTSVIEAGWKMEY